MAMQPVSVTQLTQYIKLLLDKDEILSQVCVRGELSNYKAHSSGHQYFTLKDEGAVISCVMFRSDAIKMRFRPESGMKVILYGRVSLFPKSGQYQIYVTAMQPDGVGVLAVAFEQLKRRLYEEGLFDPAHKQPLPNYPHRVALITSPTGAAVRDMTRILGRRWPMAEVLVCPVRVQGEGAAEEIAAMLDYVDKHQLADVIITGRGGGSLEDLWAFNEEIVARAIYRCTIPVISAVGHEPDVTISDYVADLRASTPSNAAELAVPDWREIAEVLQNYEIRSGQAIQKKIAQLRERLESLRTKRVLSDPTAHIDNRRIELDHIRERFVAAQERNISLKQQQFIKLAASLDAMSPLRVLARGYSIAEDENGRTIKSIEEIKTGDKIRLNLTDGSADCVVDGIGESILRR